MYKRITTTSEMHAKYITHTTQPTYSETNTKQKIKKNTQNYRKEVGIFLFWLFWISRIILENFQPFFQHSRHRKRLIDINYDRCKH